MSDEIELILESLVVHDNFRKTAMPHIKREYFDDPFHRVIFDTIRYYTEKYLRAPPKDALLIEVQNHKECTHNIFDEIHSFLNTWGKMDFDYEWMLDKTESWCQDRAIYNALTESIILSKDESRGVSRGKIPELFKDALAVSFDNSIGHDYIEDTETLYDFYHLKQHKIPFSLGVLNRITGNGVPPKTLNLIMGSIGTGKTLWLCDLSAHYMMQGKTVLYITLEMAEEEIATRIDANLIDVDIDDLVKMEKDTYIKNVNYIKNKTVGNVIIKQYPTASSHVGHFRHLLNELKLKKNIVPDVIMIDYLNICASSRMKMGGSINTYSLVKSIAEEVRGLAVEQNIPIWSATQSNKGARGASDVDMSDISESFGTAATVDFMLGLISTDDLEEMDQQIVKVLKNRYGRAGSLTKFTVNVNKSRVQITEPEFNQNIDDVDDIQFSDNKKSDFSGFKI